MKKVFVLLHTITGKMPVVRMAKMNISGTWLSTNCMVHVHHLLLAVLIKIQRQVVLQRQLLLLAKAAAQRRKLQKNNKKLLSAVS